MYKQQIKIIFHVPCHKTTLNISLECIHHIELCIYEILEREKNSFSSRSAVDALPHFKKIVPYFSYDQEFCKQILQVFPVLLIFSLNKPHFLLSFSSFSLLNLINLFLILFLFSQREAQEIIRKQMIYISFLHLDPKLQQKPRND